MSENKEFLGTEPVGKLLLKLAVPSVISQIVNMLYNIVDRIYIGHIPKTGSLALTGLGVCMPIIMIISAFAALMFYDTDNHFDHSYYCSSLWQQIFPYGIWCQ